MHFHQNGYVSADPRIEEAAGYGIDRSQDLPDEVDVLIVGAGPAGLMTAQWMSRLDVKTRIIDKRGTKVLTSNRNYYIQN